MNSKKGRGPTLNPREPPCLLMLIQTYSHLALLFPPYRTRMLLSNYRTVPNISTVGEDTTFMPDSHWPVIALGAVPVLK